MAVSPARPPRLMVEQLDEAEEARRQLQLRQLHGRQAGPSAPGGPGALAGEPRARTALGRSRGSSRGMPRWPRTPGPPGAAGPGGRRAETPLGASGRPGRPAASRGRPQAPPLRCAPRATRERERERWKVEGRAGRGVPSPPWSSTPTEGGPGVSRRGRDRGLTEGPGPTVGAGRGRRGPPRREEGAGGRGRRRGAGAGRAGPARGSSPRSGGRCAAALPGSPSPPLY